MHEGQVRAILWRHATRHDAVPAPSRTVTEPTLPAPLPDPNALLPADDLAQRLAAIPEDGQRRLAADYARLWARTFRTLVTHLRGRPECALALFADEVYPFLRGDRLAARVESASRGRATVTLAGGLPDAYLAGLAEAFVALSGAHARASVAAPGRVEVTYAIAPADRLARIVQHAASLRLNLVLAALLAAVLGIALAIGQDATVPAPRAAAVLGGIAAAQLAGNALHALRHGHPAGPLAPLRASPAALKAQLAFAGTLALAAAGWLAATGTPLVLAFAAAGAAAGLLYAPLRDRGLGPAVTAVLYGPLIAQGALHAFAIGVSHAGHLALLAWTFVPGALAAASLYIDDLADAPLDEAGGKRTLAVRLPGRVQGAVYTGLLSLGLAPLLWLVARPGYAWATLAAAATALLLALLVRRSLGDPRRLAPVRLGTQVLHVGATALAAIAAAAAGGAP